MKHDPRFGGFMLHVHCQAAMVLVLVLVMLLLPLLFQHFMDALVGSLS